jgi:hypothetical protein
MIALPNVATAVLGLLGAIHLACALHDFGPRPRYFAPTDPAALTAMRASRTLIAPKGRDYWSGILGFHLSHSIGVLLFALLVAVTTRHGITWLQPVLVLAGMGYLLISIRCWFIIPTLGMSLALIAMVAGWWL